MSFIYSITIQLHYYCDCCSYYYLYYALFSLSFGIQVCIFGGSQCQVMSADKLVMDETSPSSHPLPHSYRFMSANPSCFFFIFLWLQLWLLCCACIGGNGSGYVVRMADRGLACQLFHYIWPRRLDMLMEIVEPRWQKPSCSQKEWVIRLFGSLQCYCHRICYWFSFDELGSLSVK